MGITKTDLFSTEQNRLADIARALAHPARIAILQHLSKFNRCVNGEMVETLGLAQATISQHLKALKDAGLINGKIEGTSMSYCVNKAVFSDMQMAFGSLFESCLACDDQVCK